MDVDPSVVGHIVSLLDMERLRRDQARAIDAMVREVVEIQKCVDPDANLYQRLSGRREIHQQQLLLARGVPGLRRRPGSERVLEFLCRQQTQTSLPQSVQLGARRKYIAEA